MPSPGESQFSGKTVVTTGGGSELAQFVIVGLLRAGADVHALVPANGAGARLRAAAPADVRANLTCHTTDLSRLADVKQTVEAIRGIVAGVDVLVDIAETFESELMRTEDGIERTFAYDHLARFVVVNMLMGKLRARAPARVVSVSSIAHVYHDVDPRDWESLEGYDGWVAFCRSKQADILFMKALARRLDAGEVTANACDGGLQRDIVSGADVPFFARLMRPFIARPAPRVAQDVLWLAGAPEVEGVTGRYFVGREARKPAEATMDEGLQEALWAASLEYTGLGAHSMGTTGGLPVLR